MNIYEQDFYSWTQRQAALLKTGRLTELDVANLIEEIETMGRSEKNTLESRCRVLLVHLLKWHYQPARRGMSWILTIKGQRIELATVLKDNPGLKSKIVEILANAYLLARVHAAQQTHLDISVFPEKCPWLFEQLIDDNFFPD